MSPLSLNEARALAMLLYRRNSRPVVHGDPLINPHAALHTMMESMPERQRRRLTTAMDHIWPKPQRHKNYPVGVHQERTFGPTKEGDDAWIEAWAYAIHVASMEPEQ